MRSDAGPWYSNSRQFLSAYISGYVDGEGCFTISIAPRATLRAGWEVRPGFSVSQNGDRAEGPSCDRIVLRLRKHPTRSERQDAQVGDTPARGSPRAGRPALRAVPAPFEQA